MVKVKIYTTPTCIYCKMAKQWFKENNISYEEKDVSSDAQSRQEMIDKSQQMGVPVIEVGGELIIGFDKERLGELLNIK
ncbi:MAG: NrdH-redoxin [Candidatus Niyogibacteria bacterium RIFCSPLOWO2_12_FULL_41_13]|uniref:NrdH-redoxin n=1 Tax=Candidatus Niyogibacteria bacterium RIFCSPLOWO2_12_FULL_41_13 TaxID=1801726 RepID=A0A1G2F0Y7_9BACT|nr:MAG: NrdH-redoxin [Candidatus Niyogibacteria bacterium RIFCSPLOWO2_12_FULL_41_13]